MRRRPPVLLFESNRGRVMWVLSVIAWGCVLGMAAALYASLDEVVPGGDSPTILFLAQLLLLLVAILTDRRRRATIARIWRVPEGLVFEMQGLFRPFRRYAAQADLGRIRAYPPDTHGRMGLRLPDGGPRLVMHTGFQELNLGLPEPEHKKKRR
ncbi:hypothetical protein [Roseococcus microcysteis]|uniref:hypothetical protein n=1 Tax=Roseococcus microcysteis TaxID=2771361 RepID=UPI00168B56A2|nr:hypothetical protein [Roseococcus microcysteis]